MIKQSVTLAILFPAILLGGVSELQTLYNQKSYLQVIQKAKENTSAYNDPKLHLLWAQSAEALGKTDEAISAYERVIILQPDNVDVHIRLTKLYSDSERKLLSKAETKITQKYDLSQEQHNTLQTFMLTDDKPFKASASLSFGYDSNINVSPGDLEIYEGGGEIGTKFAKLQAYMGYEYKLENLANASLFANTQLSYQSNEAHYYDLFCGVAEAGFAYKSDSYEVALPVQYGRYYYLEKDLIESIGFVPRINFLLSSEWMLHLNTKFLERYNLQESSENQDDSVLGIGSKLFWLPGDHLVYIGVEYNSYDAKYREASYFIEKESLGLNAGLTYQINNDWALAGNLNYRDTQYDDHVSTSDDKRSDDYYFGEIKLSKELHKDFICSASYSYTENRSNFTPSEYQKNIYMLTINYHF